MKVLRSSLVAAVAIFAAACGDKVNIVQPDTSTTVKTPDVTAIAVAPTTATMSIGQTVNFSAAVTAVNGAATSVTWSSSDASKVSVSAAGVAAAVAATPGVAICATSTVNVNTKGCASVAVTAAAVNNPATVSIASITAVTTNNPVNPLATAGQIDVRVNVNPGTQTITKVRLLIGGVPADSQTFTAAAAASLRYAADLAVTEQSTFPQILFSVNTAAYDATTGIPKYTNGNKTISVQVFTAAGGATAAAATAAGETLTFTNVDVLTAKVTPVGANSAQVASVTGFGWVKMPDSTDVQILPVTYSGRVITSIGFRPFCGDSIWTKVLTPFKVRYGVPAAGYQTTNSAGGCSATAEVDGEAPVYFSAIMADGNTPPAFAIDPASLAALRKRYDNLGPSASVINPAVGIAGTKTRRTTGWFNDAVKLTTVVASTEGSASATGTNFAGSLVVTRGTETSGVSAGAASTDAAVVTYKAYVGVDLATALASTAVTSTTGIAETVAQTMCLVVRSADALGNLSPAPTACAFNSVTNPAAALIGIDRTAPSLARYNTADTLTTGAGTGYRRLPTDSILDLGGTVFSNKLVVFAADAGNASGNSGILGVRLAIQKQIGGISSCVYGPSSTTVCAFGADGFVNTVGGAGAVASVNDIISGSLAPHQGYLSITATVYDAAGNSVALGTRNGYYDTTVPTAVGVSTTTPAVIGTAGQYTVDNQDAVDLGFTALAQQYFDGAALVLNWRCSRTDLKTTFGPTFVLGDTRGLTTCAVPAGIMLKTTATGELANPSLANGSLPATAGGLVDLTSDFVGNTTALAPVAAGNTVVVVDTAAIRTSFGAAAATLRCGASTYIANSGFCTIAIASDVATYFTGGGTVAATSGNLTATVVSVDSVAIPTVPPVGVTLAQMKTDTLAAITSRAASPFAAVTFLVNDGQTDVPFAAPAGTKTVVVDSVSTAFYVVTTTTPYVAPFTPGATFGAYSPISKSGTNITTTGAAFTYRANARYARVTTAAATTNKAVATLAGMAGATNVQTGATPGLSRVNVLSQSATVTIKK